MKLGLIVLLFLCFLSCTEENSFNQDWQLTQQSEYAPQQLPDDINELNGEYFANILPMLGDARIIGMSEGTHEMYEPIKFRNELWKFLIMKERIDLVAIESGLIESKLMYDYVLGSDISIDSVLSNGMACKFGEINLNKELLEWIRTYNVNQPKNKKVHIYGYDISGCAPNPINENAKKGFEYLLNYLNEVDSEKRNEVQNQIKPYLPYLHIKDSINSNDSHFWDLDSAQWVNIFDILDQCELDMQRNADLYIRLNGAEEYSWANRAIFSAKQNVQFLHDMKGEGNYDYNIREKGQLDNLKWILEREKGKRIGIFAHLGHIAKEIHMHEENAMYYPMGGECIKKEFGGDYVVIGNFYRKLDWFDDDPIILGENTISGEFKKFGIKNFYMKLDKSDTSWQKEWPFGKPSSGGQVYMNPTEAIDIVLYNDVQTWLYHYQQEQK